MPVTQQDIDALNSALAGGERTVRHGDKLVEYRSVDELIRARDQLIAQMAREQASSVPRVSRQVRLYHGGRGFDS